MQLYEKHCYQIYDRTKLEMFKIGNDRDDNSYAPVNFC